jgi:hypothetical protein
MNPQAQTSNTPRAIAYIVSLPNGEQFLCPSRLSAEETAEARGGTAAPVYDNSIPVALHGCYQWRVRANTPWKAWKYVDDGIRFLADELTFLAEGIEDPNDFRCVQRDLVLALIETDPTPEELHADSVKGGRARGKRFVYRYPAVEGKNYEYTLEPISDGKERASGWFMRGQTHCVAGSSGAGKSTFALDLLRTQEQRGYFLGHRGAGLDYLVISGDRGRLSNEQTLDRLGMREAAWRFGFVNGDSYDDGAVNEIIDLLEARSPMPQVVFIEGADLMTEDPISMPSVSRFVGGLNELAEHYHIAVILSVGAGKVKAKDGAYRVQREQIYGSGAWGRKVDMVACLNYVADECDSRRELTISHRHGRAEHFDMTFTESGNLVQEQAKPEEVNLSDIDLWIAGQGAGEFTRKDAIEAMEEIEGSSAATVKRRIKELVETGKLAEGGLVARGRVLRLAQAQI